MAVEGRKILFSGRVQGVFFRATTRDIASRFSVAGYVRNLSDGRVELVADGERAELDAFVAAVADAMAENIHAMDTVDLESPGRFAGFEIRD